VSKMKKEFSVKWIGSKQPRKQRKYRANAPLHIKRKFMSANLAKELRKRYGNRSFPLKKGDSIKIMRGEFKGKTGKIETPEFFFITGKLTTSNKTIGKLVSLISLLLIKTCFSLSNFLSSFLFLTSFIISRVTTTKGIESFLLCVLKAKYFVWKW